MNCRPALVRSTPHCSILNVSVRAASLRVQPLSGSHSPPSPRMAGGPQPCGSATLGSSPWPAPAASGANTRTGPAGRGLRHGCPRISRIRRRADLGAGRTPHAAGCAATQSRTTALVAHGASPQEIGPHRQSPDDRVLAAVHRSWTHAPGGGDRETVACSRDHPVAVTLEESTRATASSRTAQDPLRKRQALGSQSRRADLSVEDSVSPCSIGVRASASRRGRNWTCSSSIRVDRVSPDRHSTTSLLKSRRPKHPVPRGCLTGSPATPVALLRNVQRKIANWTRADLLLPGYGRPVPGWTDLPGADSSSR